MIKWEYLEVAVDGTYYLEPAGPEPEVISFVEYLDSKGKEGWEAVAAYDSSYGEVLLLKRPLEDK